MNKTFSLVWSESRHAYVVAHERAHLRGNPGGSRRLLAALVASLFGTSPVFADPAATALPSGGQIVSGGGSIATQGTAMTVTQTTQQMIANWARFDIGADASVNFVQPNSASVALNRILGQDPSRIYGSLTANGQVMLVNPAGIVFGPNSQTNVGALVASTLQISEQSLLSGNYAFAADGAAGSVVNAGRITTPNGGVVAFLAPVVENRGRIETPAGSTLLAAGNRVTLDFAGDGLINYTIDQGAADALVHNSGTLSAAGGAVVLSARSADAVAKAVVNNTGVIEAGALMSKNGRIVLDAVGGSVLQQGTVAAAGGSVRVNAGDAYFDTGTTSVAGASDAGGSIEVIAQEGINAVAGHTFDASGTKGGRVSLDGGVDGSVLSSARVKADGTQGAGGKVEITARTVTLLNAPVSASGQTDGGVVHVGGGWQGGGELRHAQRVLVGAGTDLRADGAQGGGGEVVAWSDSETRFAGSASATGTPGGRVEISSKDYLDYAGSATAGVGGSVLFDPKNLTIGNGDPTFTWLSTFNTPAGSCTGNHCLAGALAIDGDRLAIGQWGANKVQLYTGVTGTLTYQKLLGSGTGAIGMPAVSGNFGKGLSLSGDLLAVGASGSNSVFLFNGAGSDFSGLTYRKTLTTTSGATGMSGIQTGWFGWGLALDATTGLLAVGAPFANSNQGALYMFNGVGSDFSGLNYAWKLDESTRPTGMSSIASEIRNFEGIFLKGDRLITGGLGYNAYGRVNYFSGVSTATSASQLVHRREQLFYGVGQSGFGVSFANAGDIVYVGAYNDGYGLGAVYVFKGADALFAGTSSTLTQIGKIQNGTGTTNGGWTTQSYGEFGYGLALGGDVLYVSEQRWNSTYTAEGRVHRFSINASADAVSSASYANNPSGNSFITPSAITAILNTGSSVTLQANNDITVAQALLANNTGGDGGSLALHAGRSVLINANISTDNGNLTIVANETAANGVVNAQRDAGSAVITMASGTSINTGTGAVSLTLADGAGKTNSASGDITLYGITSGSLAVTNAGLTAGSDILAQGALTTAGGPLSLTATADVSANESLSTTGANAILLKAGRDISLADNRSLSTGGGSVTLWADSDASGGGRIAVNSGASISSNGGDITLSGGANLATGYATASSTSTNQGIALQASSSIDAGGGNILLRGRSAQATSASWGIFQRGAAKTSGSGTITYVGDSSDVGSGSLYSYGIYLDGTGGHSPLIQSVGGAISLTGYGGQNTSSGHGVVLESGGGATNIQSTSGSIALTGTGSSWAHVFVNANDKIGKGSLASSSSDITLTADRMYLGGTFESSGALTIRPNSAGTTIGVGGASGTLQLPASYFSTNFRNGFSSITVGGNSAGTITANAFAISDTLNLVAGNTNADVLVNGSISHASGDNIDLTLRAHRDVAVNDNVSIGSTSGRMNVTLQAGSSNGVGRIGIGQNASISANGGNITLGGGSDIATGYATGHATNWANGWGSTRSLANGVYLMSGATLNAGGGNVTVRGRGSEIDAATEGCSFDCQYGIWQKNASVITSGTGSITYVGQGRTTLAGQYHHGVAFGEPSLVQTEAGNISLTGLATVNGGAQNYGIVFRDTRVQSASGAISIEGAGLQGLFFSSGGPTSAIGKGTLGASSSNITLTTDALTLTSAAAIESTGTLTIRPRGTGTTIGLGGGAGTLNLAQSAFWNGSAGNIKDGFSSIVIGRSDGSGKITTGALTVSDNLTLLNAAGGIELTGALNAGSNTVTLNSTGSVTDTGSGAIAAGGLALLNSSAVTLDSSGNDVGTLAASGVGSLTYLDANALTIGTVNPTGISASGPVRIETQNGDLTLAASIATSDATANAVVLNAGKAAAAGTAAGGNIIVSGSPSITTGTGGRATLYSGSVAGSTGLVALVGSGSGRFRYNSDEAASNFSAALGSGLNAVYRERPMLTVMANAATKTFDGQPYSGGNGYAVTGFVNGDTQSVLSGSLAYGGTSQGAVAVGSHGITPSGLGNSVGYGMTFVDGSLTITQPPFDASKAQPVVSLPPIEGVKSPGMTGATTPPPPVTSTTPPKVVDFGQIKGSGPSGGGANTGGAANTVAGTGKGAGGPGDGSGPGNGAGQGLGPQGAPGKGSQTPATPATGTSGGGANTGGSANTVAGTGKGAGGPGDGSGPGNGAGQGLGPQGTPGKGSQTPATPATGTSGTSGTSGGGANTGGAANTVAGTGKGAGGPGTGAKPTQPNASGTPGSTFAGSAGPSSGPTARPALSAGQFSTRGTSVSLQLTGDSGQGAKGTSLSAGNASGKRTALTIFSQQDGQTRPAGAIVITQQGQTLTATPGQSEVTSVPNVDAANLRFVDADYTLESGDTTRVSVGVSGEGVMMVRVSPAVRATSDDRRITLIGLGIAQSSLQVDPGAIKGVVIQIGR